MACVTAAAIAAMVAEAFRAPNERMPIGPLGIIGLLGAAVASALLWNRNAVSFGVLTADNFGLFVTWILIIVGILSIALSGPVLEREKLPVGEYYSLMLFSLGGMIAQQLAFEYPDMIRRMILLGTGPRGGEGMTFTELSPDELADPGHHEDGQCQPAKIGRPQRAV